MRLRKKFVTGRTMKVLNKKEILKKEGKKEKWLRSPTYKGLDNTLPESVFAMSYTKKKVVLGRTLRLLQIVVKFFLLLFYPHFITIVSECVWVCVCVCVCA
eukprot:TRINITY_DN19146_c0_g1_i3.p1 TRINITY_DN19146_c0_g1~~TRINITY_DN19146_c0_g1_i3.p1  ORF type:complete len:101 (-),score=5.35 TRINITY_DN19146_c0_g1_i3:239-541(-)